MVSRPAGEWKGQWDYYPSLRHRCISILGIPVSLWLIGFDRVETMASVSNRSKDRLWLKKNRNDRLHFGSVEKRPRDEATPNNAAKPRRRPRRSQNLQVHSQQRPSITERERRGSIGKRKCNVPRKTEYDSSYFSKKRRSLPKENVSPTKSLRETSKKSRFALGNRPSASTARKRISRKRKQNDQLVCCSLLLFSLCWWLDAEAAPPCHGRGFASRPLIGYWLAFALWSGTRWNAVASCCCSRWKFWEIKSWNENEGTKRCQNGRRSVVPSFLVRPFRVFHELVHAIVWNRPLFHVVGLVCGELTRSVRFFFVLVKFRVFQFFQHSAELERV